MVRMVIIMKQYISYLKENIAYFIYRIKDFFQAKKIDKPIVKSFDEAIDMIINNNASISRFGDGEFNLLQGKSINFQDYNEELASKLRNILVNKDDNIIVCIPDVFNGLEEYVTYSKRVWTALLAQNRKEWCNILDMNKIYYNAFISRPYVIYKDRTNCKSKFDSLKGIWKDKELLIVEGEKSRLGVGNDLFNNSKSIERIICPSINAYSKYNEIFKSIRKYGEKKLVLIALGPTATVLSYDLFRIGFQAIDIGHIDIEYEWFLRKTIGKVKVDGKFTNEAINGNITDKFYNKEYNEQILEIIV